MNELNILHAVLIGIAITIIGIVWTEWNTEWEGFKRIHSYFTRTTEKKTKPKTI